MEKISATAATTMNALTQRQCANGIVRAGASESGGVGYEQKICHFQFPTFTQINKKTNNDKI